MRRLVLVRHGETVGESSIRLHGSTDLELSVEGVRQICEARHLLEGEQFDRVVSSPMKRAWRSAWILGGGVPVHLESDFREICFGAWEGLTAEEIQAVDPIHFADWKEKSPNFEFPGGEERENFRLRVLSGLKRLQEAPINSALVVAHKGVIRRIFEGLTGSAWEAPGPALGAIISLTQQSDGQWIEGRRSSNPPGLGAAA